jgi:hypothetical protein
MDHSLLSKKQLLQLREAAAVRKAVSGARGLVRDIMRLDDGTFAPKGRGRFLKPGEEVRVPRTDGKGGFVRGKVDAGGSVDLLDGPDAGTKIKVRGGKGAPQTPGGTAVTKDGKIGINRDPGAELAKPKPPRTPGQFGVAGDAALADAQRKQDRQQRDRMASLSAERSSAEQRLRDRNDLPDRDDEKAYTDAINAEVARGKAAPQTPGSGEGELESGLKVGLALNDLLDHLDDPQSSMRVEDKLFELDNFTKNSAPNMDALSREDLQKLGKLADERGFADLAKSFNNAVAEREKEFGVAKAAPQTPGGTAITSDGKIGINRDPGAELSKPKPPKTPGVPGSGDGFIDNAEAPDPTSMKDLPVGTEFKLKNGDTYVVHKHTGLSYTDPRNSGAVGKIVKLSDGTTTGKAKFFNGMLAPKQVKIPDGAEAPKPKKPKAPGGLNLKNAGPSGKPRNVKAMSDSKLMQLAKNPDVELALLDRVEVELTKRGKEMPSQKLGKPGMFNVEPTGDALDSAISKKKGGKGGSPYEDRVREFEDMGMTTSDAQSAADVEVYDGKLKGDAFHDFIKSQKDVSPTTGASVSGFAAETMSYDGIPSLKKGTKLNLENTGPSGKLRNIKAMQPSKLKALIEHPDVDPELRNRARKQLAAKGYDVPGAGGAGVPKQPTPQQAFATSGLPAAGVKSYEDIPSLKKGTKLNLKNEGPAGKPRNIGAMQPAKLKAIIEHPDADPTLVARAIQKLEADGYNLNLGDPSTPSPVGAMASSEHDFGSPEVNAILEPIHTMFKEGGLATPSGSSADKFVANYDYAVALAKNLDNEEQMKLKNKGGTFSISKRSEAGVDEYSIIKNDDGMAAIDPDTGESMVYDSPEIAAAHAVVAEFSVGGDKEPTSDPAGADWPAIKTKQKNTAPDAPSGVPQGVDAKRIAKAWGAYSGKLEEFKAVADGDKKERARKAAQVRAAKGRFIKAGGDIDSPPDLNEGFATRGRVNQSKRLEDGTFAPKGLGAVMSSRNMERERRRRAQALKRKAEARRRAAKRKRNRDAYKNSIGAGTPNQSAGSTDDAVFDTDFY